MSVIAAILPLISSFTHAGWNFLCKKARPPIAFFFVVNTTSIICPLAILPLYLNKIELIPVTVSIFVVISGFFWQLIWQRFQVHTAPVICPLHIPLHAACRSFLFLSSPSFWEMENLWVCGASSLFTGCTGRCRHHWLYGGR